MKLYLNFDEFAKTGGGTWVDYSEALLNEGFVRKSCFGALGKAEIQTVSMRLKPVVGLTALAVAILTATNDIRAKLTLDDDTPYFIGTIRPLVSGEVREVIKPISVEILDDTSFLESYIFTADSTLSSNLKVISSTPADSLVHWLISHATVKNSLGAYVPAFATTDIVIDAGVDTAVAADGLTIETGDYVNAILDAVCYEYNLQYRCSEDGKLHFAPSVPATTVTGARTLTDSDVKNYLNPKRGDDARRGAVVTYYPVVKGACVVGRHEALDSRYADDKTFGRGYEWLNTDEPGGQWPPLAYQNITLSSYDLDKSKRKVLRYDFTTIRTKITFQDGSKSTAQSMGHAINNGDGTARVYIQVPRNKVLVKRIDCICDCWYIDEEDERTTQVHQGQNPEKYEARYLHSGTTATALLKAIVLRSTTGNLTHTFQALPALGLSPGEIVSLASDALGFTGYVRIVSVTDYGGDKERPLVDVVAESVTPLDEIVVDTSEQVRSILQRGGVTMLRLVTESTVVKYDSLGTVEVRAEGDAIDVLGGVVSWYLNDVLQGTGVSMPFYQSDMEVGDNTIRAVVAIAGVDFEDKPLDAEIIISLIQDGATGAPARILTLVASQTVINLSSRGELKTQQIEITCIPANLSMDGAVWTATDAGSLSQIEISEGVYDPYKRLLDCSLVAGDSTLISVSIIYEGQTYTGFVGITKVSDGTPSPLYLDAQSSVPTLTTEGPLVVGDFFLYVGAYSGPNSDPGDQGLNPPALEINEFVYGRIYEYLGKNAEDEDQWKESRKSEHLAAAQKDALQIAKDSNTYMFVAVLVAQLGLFFDLIVAGVLNSTNYAENASGVPTAGFKLDGLRGLIKALGLEAYEAMIYGNLESSGFRTLQEEPGTTIATASITPTLWKHSEMEALITSQDTLATLSGTIEGFSFNKATRRSNQRVLLASHGYEQHDIEANGYWYFTALYPSRVFGNYFRCKYAGYYEANYSKRQLIFNNEPAGDAIIGENMPARYAYDKTYFIPEGSEYKVRILHLSFAVIGQRGSYVSYNQVWTEQVFSGLVLVNGDSSYKVIRPEPTAYYPNSKTWAIGSVTQANYDNYCSGTDFYNKFSSIAVGADGFCDGGQINVNGTLYTVTRLTKNANSITFYTSGGVVTVNKFQEGTSVGVYTSLAITQPINFQAVAGGIEVKHIFPWGSTAGSPGTYDIGKSTARFNTAWLNILDVLSASRFRNNLAVDGQVTTAKVNIGTPSLSGNGSVQLANGLILKWGSSYSRPYYFPIAFPNACLQAVASKIGVTSNDPVAVTAVSTGSITVDYVGYGTSGFRFIAIGY